MSGITKSWIPGVRLCAVGGAVAVAATLLTTARSENEGPAKEPKAAASSAAEQFNDPEAIAQRFCSELSQVLKRQKLPSLRELAGQVAANKSCVVEVQASPGQKLTAETVYARARKSVVVGGLLPSRGHRQGNGTFATGFVIHRSGVIVTNAHVIEAFQHTRGVGVMTDDGRVLPVTAVLAGDRENDVAILKVDADNLTPLPIAPAAAVGGTVYCLSHPALNCEGTGNGFYAFTQGIVCGKFRLRLGGENPVNALAITADYAQGSSGGPILNEHGAVVGMVCHTASLCADSDGSSPQMTWKFARPSSSILALLRGAGTIPAK